MVNTLEYIPKEYFEDPTLLEANLFKVSIVKWKAESRCPLGRFLGKVGQIGALPVESISLLIDNSVFHDEVFEKKVMACLPQVGPNNPWSIPQKEREKRLDLTGLSIFTIDPLTAKDLDDAVHIRALDDGFFEVGVHIADVTYFIPKGNALDLEAAFRGMDLRFNVKRRLFILFKRQFQCFRVYFVRSCAR